MRLSKTVRGANEPGIYNYERDKMEVHQTWINESVYEPAERFQDIQLFEFDIIDTESKLDHIIEHIQIRTRITQYEIFKIGELLSIAKKICHENNMGFKKWISNNFDFSYETAVNFMNVHKYCFGQMKVALNVPVSILYKLSAPSFPGELRQYLFQKGNFDEITNGKLNQIKKKYDEGGLEAIQDDIQEINRISVIERQVNNRWDMTENYLRHLYELKEKFRTGFYGKDFVELEMQLDALEPEAAEITRDLYQAIGQAYDLVKEAHEKGVKKWIDIAGQVEKIM